MPWRPKQVRPEVEVLYFDPVYYRFFLQWLSDSFQGNMTLSYPNEVVETARRSKLRRI